MSKANIKRYRIKGITGRGFYVKEDARLPYIDHKTFKTKHCGVHDCQGRVFAIKARKPSDIIFTEVNGFKLDYKLGYILGLAILRTWLYDLDKCQFYVCFRDAHLRSNFQDMIKGKFKDTIFKNVNRYIGFSENEGQWVKAFFTSEKFIEIMDLLGLQEQELIVPELINLMPDKFMHGYFVGLLDSVFMIELEQRAYRKKEEYKVRFMPVSLYQSKQMSKILDRVDVRYVAYTENRPLTKISTIYVPASCMQDNVNLFKKAIYKKHQLVFRNMSRAVNKVDVFPFNREIRLSIRRSIKYPMWYYDLNPIYLPGAMARKIVDQLLVSSKTEDMIREWMKIVLNKNIRYELYKKPMLKIDA